MTGKCLECGGSTHPIRVVDVGHGNRHHPLKYAAVDAKLSWFRYPVAGTLTAELCESCGRVAFRAVPKSASDA